MKRIIVFLAIVSLAALSHGIVAAAPQPQPPTNVTVVNTSANPVPVAGSVTVANPNPVPVTGTVGISGTTPVSISSSTVIPVSNSAPEPFYTHDLSCNIPIGQYSCNTATSYTAPTGMRAVIQTFFCNASTYDGTAPRFRIMVVRDDPYDLRSLPIQIAPTVTWPNPALPGSTITVEEVSQPIYAVVPDGYHVSLNVNASMVPNANIIQTSDCYLTGVLYHVQ